MLDGGMRYGWFIYADEEPGETIPSDLMAVFRFARLRGCEYVLFDTDATPMEDLPIHHPEFAETAAAA